MKEPYKPLWFVLFAFAAVIAVAGASNLLKPKEVIPWRADLAAARAEAAQSGKPVFAYFTAEWCPPCQRLKSTTWASRDVERALAGYVPVKVDVDAHADLAQRYNVNGIPAFFVLDADGAVRKHAPPAALGPEDFIAWLGG